MAFARSGADPGCRKGGRRFITGTGGQKSFSGVQGQNPRKKSVGLCPQKHNRRQFYPYGMHEGGRVHPNPMNPLGLPLRSTKCSS